MAFFQDIMGKLAPER